MANVPTVRRWSASTLRVGDMVGHFRLRGMAFASGRGVPTTHPITNTTLLLPLLTALIACQPPGDPEKPNLEGETGIGGGESGVEEDDFKADGYCLVGETEGVKGYRHHCGGTLAFEVEGQYHYLGNWYPTSFGMDIGFGPSFADDWLVDDDTYDHPLVAACCGGPMDFDNENSEYFDAYQLNCALDGVQQLCAAIPRYFKSLGDNSTGVRQQRYYEIATYLNDGAVQEDCVFSIYEEADPDNVINGTTWQIIDNANADYTLTVDFLEILDIDYDEPPTECKSIYDNDDNVTPLIEFIIGSSVEHSHSTPVMASSRTTMTWPWNSIPGRTPYSPPLSMPGRALFNW